MMNLWDLGILLGVGALLVLAIRSLRQGKGKCSGSCESCKNRCQGERRSPR